MNDIIILIPDLILSSPMDQPRLGAAVAIQDHLILDIGPKKVLLERYPGAKLETLHHCLIMPGLVNAHQHGRGVSQIQLGYHDDFLELWIASRRGRGVLNPYPITMLAAANMLAHGITTTVHANYTYGSGNYEAELRASLRAYDEAGIRATVCVGAMDCGYTVYPPHEACFLAGIPEELRTWLTHSGVQPYAGDADATIALMERLLADYAGHPRIQLCYGPAGPQWVSDELWKRLARDAERRGIGLHFHALESQQQAAAVAELYPNGVFAHLKSLGAMNSRTTIAHGVWVSDREIESIARTGATVVRNPGCNLRLRNGIAPLTRYLAFGVPVAIGSDNVSLNDDEDLIKELRLAAVLARSPNWHGDPPPSSADLLAMATVNGAIAAQVAPSVGTLEPKMKADLIAIDLNRVRIPYLDPDMSIMDAFVARSTGQDVQLTMVDGRIVYRKGKFCNFDRDKLESEAALAARAARMPSPYKNRDRTQELRKHLEKHYGSIAQSD